MQYSWIDRKHKTLYSPISSTLCRLDMYHYLGSVTRYFRFFASAADGFGVRLVTLKEEMNHNEIVSDAFNHRMCMDLLRSPLPSFRGNVYKQAISYVRLSPLLTVCCIEESLSALYREWSVCKILLVVWTTEHCALTTCFLCSQTMPTEVLRFAFECSL